MRVKPSALAVCLGILGALVLIGVIWLSLAPRPPLTLTINGTEEPGTLTAWPVCTLKNHSSHPVRYYLKSSYDTATTNLGRPRISTHWTPAGIDTRSLPPIAYDPTRPYVPAPFQSSGEIAPSGKESFVLPVPPARSNAVLAVYVSYAWEPNALLARLTRTGLWVKFWQGLLKRPPLFRRISVGGELRKEFALKVKTFGRLSPNMAISGTNVNFTLPEPRADFNLSPFSRGSR